METFELEKLQWPLILDLLAKHAFTDEAKKQLRELSIRLKPEQVTQSWQQQLALKKLYESGYRPPLSELPDLATTFRAAELGQILEGSELRDLFRLLDLVKAVHRFCGDLQDRCPALVRFHSQLYPLVKLAQAIEKAIAPDGVILDTASPELFRIRTGRLQLRKRIEQQLKQLLIDQELESYLQDKFFTQRADRYVIPIRLDGRGRVKGTIYDTSDSGQTLYIEPQAISGANEQLQELELGEKLECLRILKELSMLASQELEAIQKNYSLIIELDVLGAKTAFATQFNGQAANLTKDPKIALIAVRHPVLALQQANATIANTIHLDTEQRTLIISGPNAGGKTVVLKTVGLIHTMAKAGLLLPLDATSEIYLFNQVFLELGDAQNLVANLSTFSGHLLGIKRIINQTKNFSLVLLDELAVGTDPQTGSAIGQAILEQLASKDAFTIVTTHFDALKSLALHDKRFRNGSMEFSRNSLKPTYRLILDLPGQSYGLEVAEQMGLPPELIQRARELRGAHTTQVDALIESLMDERDNTRLEINELKQQRLATEAQKSHWESERLALEENRTQAIKKLRAAFQNEVDELKAEYHVTLDDLKEQIRILRKQESMDPQELREAMTQAKRTTEEQFKKLASSVDRIESAYQIKRELPGIAVDVDHIKIGDRVYVVSLDKEASVMQVIGKPIDAVEVQVGILKMRANIQDLRKLGAQEPDLHKSKPTFARNQEQPQKSQVLGYVPSTPTNSLDLRGFDSDRGLEKMWEFIDRALMRGENHLVIIHGHGTDKLKRSVRSALAKSSPYELDFRPGESEEGGDGVTIVQLAK